MMVAEAGKKLSSQAKSARDAQRLAVQFSRPLADVTDLINENIAALQRHSAYLEGRALAVAELEDNLYVPRIKLQLTELKHPITVCTSAQCCEVYLENNKKQHYYKQRCHDPCFLNNVPEDIIGSSDLMYCATMNNQYYCKKCSCHYSKHMHVFYLTRKAEIQERDEDQTGQKVKIRNTLEVMLKELLETLRVAESEYKQEREVVVRIMAKFSFFMEHNGSPLTEDAYQKYLHYLIARETRYGPDQELVQHYRSMLNDYIHEKDNIKAKSESKGQDAYTLTLEDVFDCAEALYDLKHTGHVLRELYNIQLKCLDSKGDKPGTSSALELNWSKKKSAD
ncbi:hypothetical protein QE152_g29793 [Popillia japonica]|uniref:DUF8206 domain-containing protein n=1 Tax=Popillia japonica TaxID=7064 RepID=A0AAW1JGL9_POPJA